MPDTPTGGGIRARRAIVPALLLATPAFPAAAPAQPAPSATAPVAAAARVAADRTALERGGGFLRDWVRLTRGRGTRVLLRPDAGPRGTPALLLGSGGAARGLAAIGRPVEPRRDVDAWAVVRMSRVAIPRGRGRALITVSGDGGVKVQAGLVRTRLGSLRWGAWATLPGGRLVTAVSDARLATVGDWTALRLTARFRGPHSYATLRVGDAVVARLPRLDVGAARPWRVLVGLAHPSGRGQGAVVALGGWGARSRGPRVELDGPRLGPMPLPAPDARLRADWLGLVPGPIRRAVGPFDALQAVSGDRIVAVAEPRQGVAPVSLRFTVREGDSPTGNGTRAEFWAGGEAEGTEELGSETWNSVAVLFPAGFDAGKWTIFHQVHGGTGRPVIALQGEYGRLVVMQRGGSVVSPTEQTFRIAPDIPTDVWHNFIYRVRWYPDERGLLEVWHRVAGQPWRQVVASAGPVGYESGGRWLKPYPKLGVYRDPGIEGETVLYQGGLHMQASSFATAERLFG